VALIDIDASGAEKIARAIEEQGGRASVHPADLADVAQIRAVVRRVLEREGQIDALANVAAVYPRAGVLDVTEEHWDRVLGLDLRGTFFCCQEVLRHMLARRRGAIVNIASGAAFRPLSDMVAYCAAKAGVIGMTRVLALETARSGVRVNVVAPGHTETEGTLGSLTAEQRSAAARALVSGRWLQPEEVASAILYLCSEAAAGMQGAILHVNGGNWMP
jgi:NAD(P)-dependent dehydrogenase (short-subunit alcohol dehydrogenase family)